MYTLFIKDNIHHSSHLNVKGHPSTKGWISFKNPWKYEFFSHIFFFYFIWFECKERKSDKSYDTLSFCQNDSLPDTTLSGDGGDQRSREHTQIFLWLFLADSTKSVTCFTLSGHWWHSFALSSTISLSQPNLPLVVNSHSVCNH